MGTLDEAGVNLSALVADIGSMLGVPLPANAPQLVLDSINLTFNTNTHAFDFQCGTTLTVAGTACQLGVEITNTTFLGYLWTGDSYFQIDFMATDNQSVLTATWEAAGDQAYLNVTDLTSLLNLPAPQPPDGLDLRLSAASLTYSLTSGQFVVAAQSVTYGKAVFVAAPSSRRARRTAAPPTVPSRSSSPTPARPRRCWSRRSSSASRSAPTRPT